MRAVDGEDGEFAGLGAADVRGDEGSRAVPRIGEGIAECNQFGFARRKVGDAADVNPGAVFLAAQDRTEQIDDDRGSDDGRDSGVERDANVHEEGAARVREGLCLFLRTGRRESFIHGHCSDCSSSSFHRRL
jgi:hypothetical protein